MPMRIFLSFLSLFFIISCSSYHDTDNDCPPIYIPRENTRIYKNNGSIDDFQINVIGFDAYCYTEAANNRRYAIISPIFKIRRLEESNTTSMDIDFYVKTSVNKKDYVGINRFSQVLNIPNNSREVIVKGKETKTRIIMPPYDNFSIDLGIVLSGDNSYKAKSMFDIDYKYLSSEEIKSQNNNKVENVYIEIEDDEEVIYSEISGQPKVVKKKRSQMGCQN